MLLVDKDEKIREINAFERGFERAHCQELTGLTGHFLIFLELLTPESGLSVF